MSTLVLRYLEPVPFTIENEASLGLTETQGLLSCDGQHLVIEHRTADTVVGIVKSGSKEIAIPLLEIRSLRFEKKYLGFSNVIVLTALNQRCIDPLMDSKQGRLEMKVRRRDRELAETFCLEVSQAIMRHRNEIIAGELEE